MNYADYMADINQYHGKGNMESSGHTYAVPKWHYSYTGYDEFAVCGGHQPPPPQISPSKGHAKPMGAKPTTENICKKQPVPTNPKKCVTPSGPKTSPGKKPHCYVGGPPPAKPKKPSAASAKCGESDGHDCLPGLNMMDLTMASPAYFYMHAKSLVEYGCTQSVTLGIRNAMLEAVLLGILVGMGFAHDQAYTIIEKWRKTNKSRIFQ
jgi:hypothetical protein